PRNPRGVTGSQLLNLETPASIFPASCARDRSITLAVIYDSGEILWRVFCDSAFCAFRRAAFLKRSARPERRVATIPITNARKTMTARDAPNFHARNATDTGAAF